MTQTREELYQFMLLRKGLEKYLFGAHNPLGLRGVFGQTIHSAN